MCGGLQMEPRAQCRNLFHFMHCSNGEDRPESRSVNNSFFVFIHICKLTGNVLTKGTGVEAGSEIINILAGEPLVFPD